MSTKKSADQFVEDMLSGALHIPSEANARLSLHDFTESMRSVYDLNEASCTAAFEKYRDKIGDAIGSPLTDEQLAALSGGKSDKAKKRGETAGIAVGATVGGIGAYVVTAETAVAVSLLVAFALK